MYAGVRFTHNSLYTAYIGELWGKSAHIAKVCIERLPKASLWEGGGPTGPEGESLRVSSR